MKFTFHINHFTRIGESTNYKVMTIDGEGATVEDAFEAIKNNIPNGHRVFAWNIVDPPKEAEDGEATTEG